MLNEYRQLNLEKYKLTDQLFMTYQVRPIAIILQVGIVSNLYLSVVHNLQRLLIRIFNSLLIGEPSDCAG